MIHDDQVVDVGDTVDKKRFRVTVDVGLSVIRYDDDIDILGERQFVDALQQPA